MELKGEIKSEARNPKQIPTRQGANSQNQAPAGRRAAVVLNISNSNFEFVSYFGFMGPHTGVQPKS